MKKLFIIILLVSIIPISFAANYYVDQDNGNNDNGGQSPNDAFRTVSKAYSVLSPGDTLHFMPDTYQEAIGTLTRSGTASNPIILKSYDNNNRALFRRTIDIDASYIIIENIDFYNANSWIDQTADQTNLIIRNNEFKGYARESTDWLGIRLRGSYNRVINNKFTGEWHGDTVGMPKGSHHHLIEGNDMTNAVSTHGVIMSSGASNIIVRNNLIRNDQYRATSLDYSHSEGDPKGTNFLIENNIIIDSEWNKEGDHITKDFTKYTTSKGGFGVARFPAPNVIVRNNLLLINNIGDGRDEVNAISLHTYNANRIYNHRYYHNTIHDSKRVAVHMADNGNGVGPFGNIEFKNNVFDKTTEYTFVIKHSNRIDFDTDRITNNLISRNGNSKPIKIDGSEYSISEANSAYSQVFKDTISGIARFKNENKAAGYDNNPSSLKFEDYNSIFDAYELTSSSPGYQDGTHLTTVTSSSFTNTINVEDTLYFFDGYDIIEGDEIQIGSQTARVTDVQSPTKLKLDRSISVSSGDRVYLKKFGTNPSVGASLSAVTGQSSSTGGNSNSCHLINSGDSVSEGFALPYDPQTNNLFFKGTCDANSIDVEIGGSDVTYTYENAYYWDETAWKNIKLSGDNVGGSVWLSGDATASINADTSESVYVLSYVCKWTGSDWKCGCRDTSCSSSSWNLQIFKN